MKFVAGRFLITALFLVLGCNSRPSLRVQTTGAAPSTKLRPSYGTTVEGNFRSWASSEVRPKYPKDAIKSHTTGVAIASVQIDPYGNVSKVEVIEAPTDSIGRSVIDAVRAWRFHIPSNLITSSPIFRTAPLTFYFLFENGAPVVAHPSEVGYVGPNKSPAPNKL